METELNGAPVRFAALGGTVFCVDDALDVRGRDADGTWWYQLHPGDPLEGPDQNSYGYRATLAECTEENHSAPLYAYRWIYRCLMEHFGAPERTLFCDGTVARYTGLQAADNGGGVLYIPFAQFHGLALTDALILLQRVIVDHHLIALHVMNAAPNGALMVRFAASAEELTAMESVLAGTLALIDGKIGDLYGFTPSSPPATAEDRVKVAKVIFDWLHLNNAYAATDSWLNGTVYAALSRGDQAPVCSSYARAAHLLLDRYGIENIVCSGKRNAGDSADHEWNLVNYHDTVGSYTAAAAQWCIFDATGTPSGTLTNWDDFNCISQEGRHVDSTTLYPLPVTHPLDGEHTYTGSETYGW